MSNFNAVAKNNSHLKVKTIMDSSFEKYGDVLSFSDSMISEIINLAEDKFTIPSSGNIYVPEDKELKQTRIAKDIYTNIFGESDIQVGICFGNSTNLNSLEYHKCSEVVIAITDLVIFLGKASDIKDFKYDSSLAEAFYVPAGSVIELYPRILHFAPCKVSGGGFKSIIILTKETNNSIETKNVSNPLLFKKNKWILTHSDNVKMVRQGVYEGITGANPKINFL